MRTLRAVFLFAVVSSSLFACGYSEKVVKTQPEARDVKVVRPDDKPFHCEVLGDIQGASRAEDKEKARGGAEADLKNRTYGLKGNYAVIETDRSNPVGASGVTETVLIGKALRCKEEG